MKCSAIGIWYMAKKALEAIKNEYLNNTSKAIEEALKIIEDDPNIHTVGSHSYANAAGYLQLDAAYMEGDGRVGSVLEASTIIHPIAVARRLANQRMNVILAGPGADIFAADNDFETIPELPCLKATADNGHDTFGIIILNQGHFSLGITSSGRNGKHVGRVGDSALPGAGHYCEDGVGACIATGDGEAILRNAIAKEVVDHLYYGKSCKEALNLAGQRALKRLDYPADFCMVAMDKNGEYAAFSSNALFPFATIEDQQVRVHYLKDDEIIDEDIFLKEDYRGD